MLRGNYYGRSFAVYRWMTGEMKLRNYEVLVYAYLFSQDRHCSVHQIAKATGLTFEGAKGVIKRLEKRNLLGRQINGQKWDYTVNQEEIDKLKKIDL